MEEIVKQNEENLKKSELSDIMENTAITLTLNETQVKPVNCTKVPLSRLAAYGTAFQPLVSTLQMAINGAGGSGLYYVDTQGKTMFQFHNSHKYLGSLANASGGVGGGQAQLTPLACDPTMLFMAAVLANIDKKLTAIQETQQEMLNFLIQKERSEMRGDLKFLLDVLNNYKYNWNNTLYKKNNHIKVLDIRQDAESKIDFYREKITAKINKRTLVHSDQTVKKQLQNIQDEFKDYQLALYLFGFSSFLEVMLLENFNEEYLNNVATKIETYALNYRELYTQCYDQIADYSATSVESSLLKGLAKVSTALGKQIEKTPGISKSQMDETLIAAGSKIKDFNQDKTQKSMHEFINSQSSLVRPFIENIQAVNRLHNKPIKIFADHENLYIENAG